MGSRVDAMQRARENHLLKASIDKSSQATRLYRLRFYRRRFGQRYERRIADPIIMPKSIAGGPLGST